MMSPSPEEFMHVDTLKDNRNQRGWRVGERTAPTPNPDSRDTIGTRGDERGEQDG